MAIEPTELTVEEKTAANVWDHVDDVLAVIEKARRGEWGWVGNSQCKYIEVRIDMRDGGCILRDRDGTRISPSDLARQHAGLGGVPWRSPERELGDWQRETVEKMRAAKRDGC